MREYYPGYFKSGAQSLQVRWHETQWPINRLGPPDRHQADPRSLGQLLSSPVQKRSRRP
jgi:hypothetical protein